MPVKFALTVLFLYVTTCFAHRKDIIVIEDTSIPLSQKEAILILPGFGSKIHGVKDIRDFFIHKGYDVYIPHYIGRDSLQQCVFNLNIFIEKHHLLNYKKLHVFSYIAGSWVLNMWLQKHSVNNIASIVYDRSPFQERAPYVLVKDKPLLIKLVVGKIMYDFSQTLYPTNANDSKNIGIIIENKPTQLILKHKKTALMLGEFTFSKDSLKQPCDDYLYECINHDEMYFQFSNIGPEILNFFKNGNFSSYVRKEPFIYDVFDKKNTDCGLEP